MKRAEWEARAETVRRMTDAGARDAAIAAQLGISRQQVFRIRKRFAIAANFRGDGSRIGEGKAILARNVDRKIDPAKAAAITAAKRRYWQGAA